MRPVGFAYAPNEENKKGVRKFSARFLTFSNKILTVQKIVLSSSRGQGNFWGLEASRPRPRTWKCVFEDSTSGYCLCNVIWVWPVFSFIKITKNVPFFGAYFKNRKLICFNWFSKFWDTFNLLMHLLVLATHLFKNPSSSSYPVFARFAKCFWLTVFFACSKVVCWDYMYFVLLSRK